MNYQQLGKPTVYGVQPGINAVVPHGEGPSLDLLRAALRIVGEVQPAWWVVENVRGAARYFNPLLGEPRQSHGPFFLWGQFPEFRCRVRFFKEKLSSAQKAERAKVPYALSDALARACESCWLVALPSDLEE